MVTSCQALLRLFGVVLDLIVHLKNSIIIITCLTWVESVKRDLKDWNISKEIALDRSVWRLAINVPEP